MLRISSFTRASLVIARSALIRSSPRRLLSHSFPLRNENGNLPWYLREENASNAAAPLLKQNLPEMPENSTASLESLTRYVSEDLGMGDVEIYDLRDPHFDNSPMTGSLIIIGSGKSDKHLQKAASELIAHLKHEYDLVVECEGLISNAVSLRQERRMRRKAKGPSATQDDFGVLANTWIMCDAIVDNIYIHLLTPSRRKELNLEYLWTKPELRKKPAPRRREENDDIFSGIRSFHTSAYSRFPSVEIYEQHSHLLGLSRQDAVAHVAESVRIFDEGFHWLSASQQEYRARGRFLSTCHKLDPKVVSLDHILENYLLEYSSGNALHVQDYVSLLEHILENPPTARDPKTFQKLALFFRMTNVDFSSNQQEWLYQMGKMLISISARFSEKGFVTPTKIYTRMKDSEWDPRPNTRMKTRFSAPLNGVVDILQSLKFDFLAKSSENQQLFVLIACIYVNAYQWDELFLFVEKCIADSSVETNGIKVANLPWDFLMTALASTGSREGCERAIARLGPLMVYNGVSLDESLALALQRVGTVAQTPVEDVVPSLFGDGMSK